MSTIVIIYIYSVASPLGCPGEATVSKRQFLLPSFAEGNLFLLSVTVSDQLIGLMMLLRKLCSITTIISGSGDSNLYDNSNGHIIVALSVLLAGFLVL